MNEVLAQPPSIKRDSVTMLDVAREVGVSKMTVSYALNGTGRMSQETRKAVLDAAQRLGFERNPHAQRLSNGRCNNTIGLFALWFDFGVGTQKIQSIQGILNEHGFDVPIYGVGLHNHKDESSQAAAIATIRRQKPRALVCATAQLHPKAVVELERYQSEGGTVVCYDYPIQLDCDSVLFDREDNTYQATRHLLELGHRDIAIGFHGVSTRAQGRVLGFKRALQEFGVEPMEEWLMEGKDRNNDYSQGGVTLAKQFMTLKRRPTAMCIVNDYAALAFIAELQRYGLKCPEDVSIVGHDDHPMSRHFPVPLTTVSHPAEEITHQVTQFLLSRLDSSYSGQAREKILHGELIIRQSTAPFNPKS